MVSTVTAAVQQRAERIHRRRGGKLDVGGRPAAPGHPHVHKHHVVGAASDYRGHLFLAHESRKLRVCRHRLSHTARADKRFNRQEGPRARGSCVPDFIMLIHRF